MWTLANAVRKHGAENALLKMTEKRCGDNPQREPRLSLVYLVNSVIQLIDTEFLAYSTPS